MTGMAWSIGKGGVATTKIYQTQADKADKLDKPLRETRTGSRTGKRSNLIQLLNNGKQDVAGRGEGGGSREGSGEGSRGRRGSRALMDNNELSFCTGNESKVSHVCVKVK